MDVENFYYVILSEVQSTETKNLRTDSGRAIPMV